MKATDSKIGLKVELTKHNNTRGIICGPVDKTDCVPVMIFSDWGATVTRTFHTSYGIPYKFLGKHFLRLLISELRMVANEKTCITCLKTRTRHDISTIDLALDGKCWSCYAK